MRPSSAHCRSQEAAQLERARNAQLDNVRIVAERAAKAWALEAVAAEKREAQKVRAAALAAARGVEERSASENPDRGFACT